MSTFPSITVSSQDYDRLMNLIDSVSRQDFPSIIALEKELDRADVVEPENMSDNIITMNSTAFVRDNNGHERHLTLVYPKEANFDKGKISILAPVGVAMLGLSVGQSIDWVLPDGKHSELKVIAIDYQPEASGELHR